MDLTRALDELKVAVSPKGVTNFPRFGELPIELRLKIYRYAGETARNDCLHRQYWSCQWQASSGHPADASPNFEALQEISKVYEIPITDGEYCQCEMAHTDYGWLDVMYGTLYSPNTSKLLRMHHRWPSATPRAPFSTITQMTSRRGCGRDIDKIRRVVVEFSTACLSDCVWKDEFFRILMSPEKAVEYIAVEENSQGKQSGELVEVELAGGNLEGIQDIPELWELVVVASPGELSQLGWTKSLALRHILLRLELCRVQRPEWEIPKVRLVEYIEDIEHI